MKIGYLHGKDDLSLASRLGFLVRFRLRVSRLSAASCSNGICNRAPQVFNQITFRYEILQPNVSSQLLERLGHTMLE